MTILWVTSFNKKLYEVSGKALLESFNKTKSEGCWFLGVEELEHEDLICMDTETVAYPLEKSDFLKKWLKDNEDIIPESLGGISKPCNCNDPYSRHDSEHKRGCHHNLWNRNCSRWFRKFATLFHALEFFYTTDRGFTKFCWIDCDVIFLQQVTQQFLLDFIFKNHITNKQADITYLQGNRKILEGGFYGYALDGYGLGFLQDIFAVYETGEFRKLLRWDDCYSHQKLITRYRHAYRKYFFAHDLGTVTWGKYSDIFTRSKLGKHLQHFKGRHEREMGIFK